MLEDAKEGLNQLGQLLKPASLGKLARAGLLDPRTPIGIAASVPWLVGRGPSIDILVRSNAVTIGKKVALVDHEASITYRELEHRANALARHLLAHKPTGSVATMLRNSRHAVESLLATTRAGLTFAPLNTWASGGDLAQLIEAAAPTLLVASKEFQPAIDRSGYRGDILWVEEGYEQAIASNSGRPLSPLMGAVGQVVIHTSGTTGRPKGARRDASGGGVGALLALMDIVPYRRSDVIWCPVPLFHSFGLMTMTVALSLGATLALPRSFKADSALEQMAAAGVTAASMTPVMIRRLVAHHASQPHERPDGLRIVVSSGAFLPPELRRNARELLGDVLYDLYGSTEAGWVAIATPDDMRTKPSSVGRPPTGVTVTVTDEDGSPLATGESGRIKVTSGLVFSGYESGAASDGSWFTGDLGHIDEDGALYVEGRADDMVVVGGENVYPAEVEQVIEKIPGVVEAAVAGIDDEDLGHALAAWVEGDVSEDQVLQRCAAELASFKVPRVVTVMDELPRNATGKVLKRQLTAKG